MIVVFFNKIKKYLYEKNGVFKLEIFRNKWFLGVLFLKLLVGSVFASNFLTKLFIPFVNYFVESGFQNPYQFFYSQNILNIFPYPNLMLWFLSIPSYIFSIFLNTDIWDVSLLNLFVVRLPILVADIIIFIILVRWLKNKQNKVLLYYWCSPILLYINYIHGQLDVIPMMLLFVFLYFLFKERFIKAFIFLGLSLAAKTGMAVVLPFVFVYLILKRIPLLKFFYYLIIPLVIFFILNLPYLFDIGFQQIVFNNREQLKIFDLNFGIGGNLTIYLVPLVYFFLFIKSLTYRTFNRDIFLMFLGFSFGILTLLIPPMQGWYYWVIPFFIYFYVKQDNAPSYVFVLLNFFYFFYFAFIRNSDFFQVWQVISPTLASIPNFYHQLSAINVNIDLIVSVLFTLLQGTLLINILWIYKKGIENFIRYKINYQPYLIGVAGDSGSGKSILTDLLVNKFGMDNTLVVAGDDLHCWERGDVNWSHFTHLDPKANHLHEELQNILELKDGKSISRSFYDHVSGKFTLPRELNSKRILIFQGLHSFYLNKMRELYDLKIFLQPMEELRAYWKVKRDTQERGYEKDQILSYLEERQEDSLKYIQKQADYADLVITFATDTVIANLEANNDCDLYLKIQLENNINLEPLLFELAKIDNFDCCHSYFDDKQFIEFRGEISVEEIDKLAYNLVPEIWEVNKEEPKWEPGYNGLIQLFVAYYIFSKMKLENRYVV